MNAKEILFTLLYLVLFNFVVHRFKIFQLRNFKPFVTHLLFNIKFVAGLIIWLIYTFYYKDIQNNDAHKFYNNALAMHEIREQSPHIFWMLMAGDASLDKGNLTSKLKNWDRNFDEAPINTNRTLIRLNSLMMFVSFKVYTVHILFFCFFSLIGWVLLANSILSFTNRRNSILALPILFLPSVLFWTSGVMKEPMLVLGLGLLVSGIISKANKQNAIIKKLIEAVSGAVIVFFTKFFILPCLLPAVVAFLLFRKREAPKVVLLKYVIVGVGLLLLALNFYRFAPNINPLNMLIEQQTKAVNEAEFFNAGSQVEIPLIKNDFASVLKSASAGILNAFVRPFIWEATNIMMAASGAENIIIITFIVMFITNLKWCSTTNLNLFLFLFSFSLAYFALIGMIAPVVGNLVRYKSVLLPVFLFAFIVKVNPSAVADSLNFVLRNE